MVAQSLRSEALKTDPFVSDRKTSDHIRRALQWQAARTPAQVEEERERVIRSLEDAGNCMWESGVCSAWWSNCDSSIQKISETVNGPLLTDLTRSIGHPDLACVEFFRKGSWSLVVVNLSLALFLVQELHSMES